ELLADHDVVFVATGRNWPGDAWRRGRGLQVNVGRTEESLILKFALEPSPELGRVLDEVRGALGRFQAKGQATYVLRPGPSEEQGWLWIMGLGSEMLARMKTVLAEQQGGFTFSSFRNMWSGLGKGSPISGEAPTTKKGSRAAAAVLKALSYVDEKLRPLEVTPRFSEASYWHSEEVVQRIEKPDGSVGWIVLVGDAACGKPFYLGSNLNGHFQDATALLAAPWTRWASAAQDAQQK
ncbi:unnamed protein product, partial [Polarella glacialis]